MGRLQEKLRVLSGRIKHWWGKSRRAAKRMGEIYDKVKEGYETHRDTIDKVKEGARKYGGKWGQKAADLADKGQSKLDQGVRKVDQVREKVNEGYRRVHTLSGGRI